MIKVEIYGGSGYMDRISVSQFMGDVVRYRKTISQFSEVFLHTSSFRERPTSLSGRNET